MKNAGGMSTLRGFSIANMRAAKECPPVSELQFEHAMEALMPKDRSFLFRVREALPELHPAERRLGEFVCDFPGELASYSAQELAALAHVSKATVTRFIQRLGYETYEEARRHARAERQTGSRLFLATSADATAVQSVASHVAQGVANIEATFAAMPDSKILSATDALLRARKVWVIGFRSSHPFAAYLQWQLTQVIENIVAIPGPGETLGEHLVSVGENDVVVFFAMRRRIAQSDAILESIRKSKAKLLYVTDESAQYETSADWHFQCQTLAPGPLFNHTAVMALCHLLISRCLETAGVEGRARLREIETLNERFLEL